MAKVTYFNNREVSNNKLLEDISNTINKLSLIENHKDDYNYWELNMKLDSLIKEAKIRKLKISNEALASKIFIK